jgi:Lipocalin-like domain
MTDGEVANKLLGAWRYVGTRINGGNWDRGKNPKGMIYYGPHGEMAVQIAPDVERKRTGAVMTGEEARTALLDYIAYFGSYTIDERAGTVTHHRQASIQPGDSGDLVRKYEFVGDRLILRTADSKL